ncbi:MAG: class I SAM-dependent methyltransferase [Smithellaceae bacterium]
MQINHPSRIVRFLTCLRDSRWLWNMMGSIYNKRIYDAICELYDDIVCNLKIDGFARILDAGAGRGYVSLMLSAQYPQSMITGIDFSSMQVRMAENFRKENNIPNCAFTTGNVMNLPFQAGLFDAVVSVGSIKHWPDGLRGLQEIHRVLKPGGRLVISETDMEASDEALRLFIRRFRVWFVPDRLLLWGLSHVIFGQSYSESGLASVVAQAGFRNITSRRVADCPYVIVTAGK